MATESSSHGRHGANKGEEETVKSKNEIKLVLMGISGSGKSSLGNTILGLGEANGFRVGHGFGNCTVDVEKRSDCNVTVVDTPGLLDIARTPMQVAASMVDLAKLVDHSIDAFLLVVPVQAWSLATDRVFELIEMFFGKEVFAHSVIVLTKARPEHLVQIKKTGRAQLESVLKNCTGRCLVIHNDDADGVKSFREQLLKKVQTIQKKYDGKELKNAMDKIQTLAGNTVNPETWLGKDIEERMRLIGELRK